MRGWGEIFCSHCSTHHHSLTQSVCSLFHGPAVKEAAVQRRHNLYRDSLILTNSDPNLQLLGEIPSVEWSTKFGGDEVEGSGDAGEVKESVSSRRRKQVVSMIQLDGVPLPYESCLEVPGVELIPEEDAEMTEDKDGGKPNEDVHLSDDPKSPDSVNEIRGLINPMLEMVLPASERNQDYSLKRTGTEIRTGTVITQDGLEEDITHLTTKVETVSRKSVRDKSSPQAILRELKGIGKNEDDKPEVFECTSEEMEVRQDASEHTAEVSAAESDTESSPKSPLVTDSSLGSDSGFQSLTSKGMDEVDPLPLNESLDKEEKITSPVKVV